VALEACWTSQETEELFLVRFHSMLKMSKINDYFAPVKKVPKVPKLQGEILSRSR